MTADPPHAAETLVSLCPVVFRSHWASLIDVSDGAPRPSFSTTLAPDLTPEVAARLHHSTPRTALISRPTESWLGRHDRGRDPTDGRPGDRHRPLGWTRISTPRSPDCIIWPRS